MATVLDLRRTDDPRDIVHRTVESLARGQVVAIPTETVYGLAADALNPDAVARLIELKRQPPGKPLVLAVRGAEEILDFVCHWSPLAQRFANRCLPGPLTLVAPVTHSDSLVTRLPEAVRQSVVGPFGCLGFRVVDHPVVAQLQQYLRGPLVLAGAAEDGTDPPTDGGEVVRLWGERVPLVLDDGPTRYGGASTVARVIDNHFEILRHGAIEAAAMNEFAKPLVVIVCTGNTCRSPMAEGLLKRRLVELGEKGRGMTVLSAGVAACEGAMASPQAVEVMASQGVDISNHRSRPLNDAVISRADLVLTLTRGHRAAILAAWPELESRVQTLRIDGGDIGDPVGGSVELYETCAQQIAAALDSWMPRLQQAFLSDGGETDECEERG